MFFKSFFALNFSVTQLANLCGVELAPCLSLPTVIKILHAFHAFEIDKSVAHVAHCLWINLQIKKIKEIVKALSDLVQQHVLSILVGNVLNH